MVFERSENKPTLQVQKYGGGDFLVVCIYVDDMIYTGPSEIWVVGFKSCMQKEFEMLDLSMMLYFLRLEVKQVEDGNFLFQRKYTRDL